MYTRKANGAYGRWRDRWIKKDEKISTYLFGLEKQRQTKNKISKLMINDTTIEDHICLLYCNLYKSKFNKPDCDFLFGRIDEKT